MRPQLQFQILDLLDKLAEALDLAERGWSPEVVKRIRDLRGDIKAAIRQWKQDQADATPR